MPQPSTEYELITVTDLQIYTVNSEKPIDVTVSPEDHLDIETQSHDVHCQFHDGGELWVAGQHVVGWSKVIRQVKRAKPATWTVPSGDKSVR